MALFPVGLIGLRNDPRLLKLPPYLSLLCVVIGICWLLVLPLDQYSRRTYVSENALLPGQVNTYFGGSEHEVFRAYRHEVAALYGSDSWDIAQGIATIFKEQNFQPKTQNYSYKFAGITAQSTNVYTILTGPRADATEAIVLIASFMSLDDLPNTSGVALLLTLARYFKRWSLWSKDIIFVVTGDGTAGPQAWVDAYHSTHDPALVQGLTLRSGGALQAAVAVDYTAGIGGHRFDKIHLVYDGINGQLPNLDVLNTVVDIASHHMGIGCAIQRMFAGRDSYKDRLTTIGRGMITQGLGHPSGPHSSFIPYHVDAITLKTVGDGIFDEISLGRVIESTFRSLNNLLEHLHQSFFLYLLMHVERFVSIATYLPSAMLIAVNFSIMSIALWIQSARVIPNISPASAKANAQEPQEDSSVEVVEKHGQVAVLPKAVTDTSQRNLLFATAFVLASLLLGLVPLYLFNTLPQQFFRPILYLTAVSSAILPFPASKLIQSECIRTPRTILLISSISLLILGTALSTLSTLNFALGFLIGLICTPITFISTIAIPQQQALHPISTSSSTNPKPRKASPQKHKATVTKRQRVITVAYMALLYIISPTTLIFAAGYLARGSGDGVTFVLAEAAKAWHVSGVWTSVVVWLVWWPAWFVGMSVGVCGLLYAPMN